MHFMFAHESDRRMAAGALRLYADDCRKLAALNGTLGPDLAKGASQADRLAAQIDSSDDRLPGGGTGRRPDPSRLRSRRHALSFTT